MFSVVGGDLVFFGGVLPRFFFYCVAIRSRNCSRDSLRVSSPVLGSFSLSWFLVDVVLYGFFLFVPAALVLSSVLAVCPFFFAFFSGCFSGPCAFFGFSQNIGGLRALAPSEAFFLDARRQGCSG